MPSRTSKHRLAPPDATSGYCGTEPQAHSLLTFCRYSLWRVSALFVSVQIHTKYSCVNCTVIICNVCLVPAQEHELGYSEENYRVGKCKMLNNLTLCQLSSRGPRIKCVGQTKKYHARTSNWSKGEIYTTTTTAMSR